MAELVNHIPVLLKEVIEGLDPKSGEIVVDATLGHGGHSLAIGDMIGDAGWLIGIDADDVAIKRAESKLSMLSCKLSLVQGNFRKIGEIMDSLGASQADKILFDLGLGTHTLSSDKGFSFQTDSPLVMTFENNPEEGKVTAYDVVNNWDEENLSMIIRGFGEDRRARAIARCIVEARSVGPIKTSAELAMIIEKAFPKKFGIHPATKTFQAIRIAVNDELGAIKDALATAWQRLAQGGRIAVISFHSLEDRIVKRTFKEWSEVGGEILTKRPLTASDDEIVDNPRSRSAKLRIIKKQN